MFVCHGDNKASSMRIQQSWNLRGSSVAQTLLRSFGKPDVHLIFFQSSLPYMVVFTHFVRIWNGQAPFALKVGFSLLTWLAFSCFFRYLHSLTLRHVIRASERHRLLWKHRTPRLVHDCKLAATSFDSTIKYSHHTDQIKGPGLSTIPPLFQQVPFLSVSIARQS